MSKNRIELDSTAEVLEQSIGKMRLSIQVETALSNMPDLTGAEDQGKLASLTETTMKEIQQILNKHRIGSVRIYFPEHQEATNEEILQLIEEDKV